MLRLSSWFFEDYVILKMNIYNKITMAENKNKNSGNGIALGTCFGVVFGAAYGIISGNISRRQPSVGTFGGSRGGRQQLQEFRIAEK